MALPKQNEIELPLLKTLVKLGGEAKPSEVYPAVLESFPDITDADLAERVGGGKHSKWTNRVQWVRQKLIVKGQMESGGWGIWKITEKGRARVAAAEAGEVEIAEPPVTNLEDIWDTYEAAFREQTLERLHGLKPQQFERFGREFLRAYGFVDVQVTSLTADGGVDGSGKLKVGLATMRVAFQCKRWQGSVGRPEIDKFRGAIQGKFEQGIFFTTSDFTKQAKTASIQAGAVPIVLINGEEIVDIMVARGLGVAKRPLHLFETVPIPGVDEDL